MIATISLGNNEVNATTASQIAQSLRGKEIVFIVEDDFYNTNLDDLFNSITLEKVEPFRYIEPKIVFPKVRNMKLKKNFPILPRKTIMNKNSMRRNTNRTQTL